MAKSKVAAAETINRVCPLLPPFGWQDTAAHELGAAIAERAGWIAHSFHEPALVGLPGYQSILTGSDSARQAEVEREAWQGYLVSQTVQQFLGKRLTPAMVIELLATPLAAVAVECVTEPNYSYDGSEGLQREQDAVIA